MKLTYRIILEPGEEGGYVVSVPALPGCFTQGASVEQAVERAHEAIEVYVAGLIKSGEQLPPGDASPDESIDVPVTVTVAALAKRSRPLTESGVTTELRQSPGHTGAIQQWLGALSRHPEYRTKLPAHERLSRITTMRAFTAWFTRPHWRFAGGASSCPTCAQRVHCIPRSNGTSRHGP
jgi:antitoxin HicB